jgi:hypothetical protein
LLFGNQRWDGLFQPNLECFCESRKANATVQRKITPVMGPRQPSICDEAWALIAPLLPAAAATGRPQKWTLRLLLEAVLYLLRNGCQWRALPAAFPP